MKSKLLKELCIEDKCGIYGIPATAEDYNEDKTRYLRITDISEDGKLLNNSKKSVSSKDIEKYILEEGDLVFARTGNSTGKTYYHEAKNGRLAFAGFLIKYSLDPKLLNTKYLRYYTITKHYKEWVENFSLGSTRGNINAQSFGECPIPLPERLQQDYLVKVLSDLDAKIELNNRINAELEAMAKTLYDYWFVQFDFPDVNSKPYKTSGGKMVWNEALKREIPEGWKAQVLEQIVEIISGNVSPNDIDKNTPYIGLEHIPRRTIVLSEWETAEKINSDKCIFKKHDILFGKIRPYFHKVGIAFIDGVTSTDTIVLRPRENSCQGFALQTVFSDDFVETATNSSTGSKMPRANWNILKNYKIAIPSKKILDTYQLQFNNIIKKIELSVLENQELASLRDWLLPMLMNGQVSVGEVEEELGMVAEGNVEYKKE